MEREVYEMILEIKRKYFYFWLRIEWLNTYCYACDYNDGVKGLCVFIGRLFIHLYIRIGSYK